MSTDWNPADEFLGPDPRDVDEAADAIDELHRELEKLEQTGVALRAERDRLDAELSRVREERRIIELGASQELWRWQFTWFWEAVSLVARLERTFAIYDRLINTITYADGHADGCYRAEVTRAADAILSAVHPEGEE